MGKWPIMVLAILSGLVALLLIEILAPVMTGDFPPCQDGTWDKERQTCIPDSHGQ